MSADSISELAGDKPNTETTLVMLSGGTDSVYYLYKILAETDHEVLVHHMHNLNRKRRHVTEKMSCEKVLAYLRQHTRPFEYSESTINHQSFDACGLDFFLAAHTAGLVARDYMEKTGKRIKGWVSGVCAEDLEETAARLRHFDNLCAAACYPYPHPVCVFMKPFPTKAEEIAGMPAELARLAWSCRRPIWTPTGPNPCGECHTCEIVQPIIEARASSDSSNVNLQQNDLGFQRWKESFASEKTEE